MALEALLIPQQFIMPPKAADCSGSIGNLLLLLVTRDHPIRPDLLMVGLAQIVWFGQL